MSHALRAFLPLLFAAATLAACGGGSVPGRSDAQWSPSVTVDVGGGGEDTSDPWRDVDWGGTVRDVTATGSDATPDVDADAVRVQIFPVVGQPVSTCEEVLVTARAVSPRGRRMEYAWEVVSAPPGAAFEYTAAAEELRLDSATPGVFELRVEVCETTQEGGCASATTTVEFRLAADEDGDGEDERCEPWDPTIELDVVADDTPWTTCSVHYMEAAANVVGGFPQYLGWEVVDAPAGGQYRLSVEDGGRAVRFLAATPGSYVFTAAVRDGLDSARERRMVVRRDVALDYDDDRDGADERCLPVGADVYLHADFDTDKLGMTCREMQFQPFVLAFEGAERFSWDWQLDELPSPAVFRFEGGAEGIVFLSAVEGVFRGTGRVCVEGDPTRCGSAELELITELVADVDGDGVDERCVEEQTLVWTTDEEFRAGVGFQVVIANGDVSLHPETVAGSTSILWVPSSRDDYVVPFDLATEQPLYGERYPVCDNPSRLGRSGTGDAFVTCRGDGRAMRVTPGGTVVWDVDVTDINGSDALRGAAVAEDPTGARVYVGCSDRPQIVVLDAESGEHRGTIDAIWAYGLATDSSRLYVTNPSDGVVAIDLATDEVLWRTLPGALRTYGIASAEDAVWVTAQREGESRHGVCKLDGSSGDIVGCALFPMNSQWGRGLGLSPIDGSVWAAVNSVDAVMRVDAELVEETGYWETGAWETAAGCTTPLGIAVGSDAVVNVVCYGTNAVVRMNPAGEILSAFGQEELDGPYAYSSDLAGVDSYVGGGVGRWRTGSIDAGMEAATFSSVSWDADVPPGTALEVSASVDGGPVSGVAQGEYVGTGRTIELFVSLSTEVEGVVPVLHELRLDYFGLTR